MPTIVDLFKRFKRDIDKTVDTTFYRLLENDSPIDRIIPMRDYRVRKFLMLKFNHSKPTLGSIIAEEQEVPISRGKMAITEEMLGNLKIGKAYGFLDKHYELMNDAENYFSTNREMYNNIVEYFLGIAEQIPGAIVGKHTLLTLQIASTAACLYTDPITTARVEITYPDADVGSNMANLVQTNDPAAGVAWATSTGTPGSFNVVNAAARGLEDLRLKSEVYFDRFGKYPSTLIMRSRTLRWLRGQTLTRTTWSVMQGGTAATAAELDTIYLNDAQLIELIKNASKVTNVIFFDSMYSEESAAGGYTDKYYLGEDQLIFLDEGILERAFVPTIERNFQPGIYAITEKLKDIPLREQLVGIANGIPACFDARKLCAMKVGRTAL